MDRPRTLTTYERCTLANARDAMRRAAAQRRLDGLDLRARDADQIADAIDRELATDREVPAPRPSPGGAEVYDMVEEDDGEVG